MPETLTTSSDAGAPHILAIAAQSEIVLHALTGLTSEQLTLVDGPVQAAQQLAEQPYDLLVVDGAMIERVLEFSRLARANSVIDMLPIGVALVEPAGHTITWHNKLFREWCLASTIIGQEFFAPFGAYEVVENHDPSPFHSARLRKKRVETLMKTSTKQYLAMEVLPIFDTDQTIKHYLITLVDRTEVEVAGQKLTSLQDAGRDLGNISPRDVCSLSEEERIDLLKGKIIAYTEDILHYDKIEIRLLSHEEEGRLDPLLAVGLRAEAMERKLYALPEGNGITGLVAYHAKSVLVEDADSDPHFLIGATGAKSSMTVPLINSQREVIGTFNVESVERGAFTKTDLEFLETFGRDVATAIHTLELLSLEQSDATFKSVETIHRNVARPINAILNHAVRLLSLTGDTKGSESTSGVTLTPTDTSDTINDGLEAIQTLAREVMVLIQRVGDRMAPSFAAPVAPTTRHPLLFDRRILVIDEDESVCIAVNSILFRYGCRVEFAPDVTQAIRMASRAHYDVFISDIRPGERSGYDLLLGLQGLLQLPFVPLILMKGYGYDAGHVTVKAKEAGVIGFLAKPFILDQMIANIEKVVAESQKQNGDRWPIRTHAADAMT